MFHIKFVNKLLDSVFKELDNVALAKKSVAFGVWISLFLVLIKMAAWLATDSISLQASMTDSLLDVLSSFIAFHALKYSYIKFDEGHNFGHEKVEGIVAMFQCLLILYSGVMILNEAYEAFTESDHIQNTNIGIIVMIISTFAVYSLIYFQKYVAGRTSSMLVKGDSLHYLSDFCMNLGVILSLVLSKVFPKVDVVFGSVVGIYVLYSAVSILRNALIDLMDESLPKADQKKIRETIESTTGVSSLKLLRTRSAGMKKYIETRIGVDGKISVSDAMKIATSVRDRVSKLYERTDVVVSIETK